MKILLIAILSVSAVLTPQKDKAEEIYNKCVEYRIKHPKIVTAQAVLESGWFTSHSYQTRKNFLGLYDSKNNELFSFESEDECLLKYKAWIQDKYYTDGQDYYEFLNCMWTYNGKCKKYGYSSNYTETVKKIAEGFDF